MNKPTLLVLAAGMGSRFGGLKQIEPLGPNGEIIIDYSVYDAKQAGFEKVVFVIKPELLDTFKEVIGSRVEKFIEVDYAFQTTDMVPEGYTCPEGRTRPWGTGHAVWCAREHLSGPFGIINADDFYGRDAYMQLGKQLREKVTSDHMCMVGFALENTLTENGSVSRGVCEIENGMLQSVTEHTKIVREGDHLRNDGIGPMKVLPLGAIASVNVWGLHADMFPAMTESFKAFLDELTEENALTKEFFLPAFVDSLIKTGKADVEVLPTTSKWYGVTYREDKENIMAAMAKMHEDGIYPKLK
ncbi:MAG: NTP transferase domain-containing protein, partial [Clostridia bacterium]|nr:NTP transferase domain-containing protein [Clostridia bacterium]